MTELDELELEVATLQAAKAELIAALQHLLAKPRCPRCRAAAQAVVDRLRK